MHPNLLSWSTALNPMVPVERPTPGLYIASGPRLLPSWFLTALCPALAHGTRLFWIDAGNNFNAYGASYAAHARGWAAKPVLAQISLARPFNLFQLATMVRQKVPALWRGEPVVISDPFPLLYDEDVPTKQARRVFVSILEGMKALPALWLILTVERKAPPERAGWYPELTRHARGLASLQGTEDQWHLEKQ